MLSLLPREIVGEIICHLYSDNEALKTCSILSTSFTAFCQSILFSKIILRGPRDRTRILWPPDGGSASNFKRVLDTSPHIANDVTCLEIFDTLYVGSEEWVSKDDALPACLLRLTHLKALLITYSTNSQLSQWPAKLLRCLEETMKLSSLVCLELMGYPLTLLERGGMGLQHLTLPAPKGQISDSTRSPLFSISETVAARIQPVSLALRSENVPLFLKLIICPVLMLDLSKLRRLAVHAGMGASLMSSHGAVAQLLRVCARTLEELIFYPYVKVGSEPEADLSPERDPIDPSILTSLRRLTIHIQQFKYTRLRDSSDTFPWLLAFLFQLASSRTSTNSASHPSTGPLLEGLNVLVLFDTLPLEQPDIEPWKAMASLLTGNLFPNLRKTTFVEVSTPGNSAGGVLEGLRDAGHFSSLREGLKVGLLQRSPLAFRSPTLFALDANCEWAGSLTTPCNK